ncbi:uncharacterized protein [Rutidosis leptorrhynchoides]|uniref:uncharacterized protein n=1 Tax=Rutidosis leptorrhynchoides TaxID=125765 RepID=UPI003A9900EC
MQKLKGFSEGCYKFLADIAPHRWARSHFSCRAMTDALLNTMCEILNRWLVDARDKPIITALEYIREYLMKMIVTVNNMISKSDGPLTLGATKVFNGIKKQAQKYTVLWSGDHLYQVSGPHNDQCVVDMNARVCACRKWEISAMPCKQTVAALYHMGAFGERVGHLESWVHRVHWLETWKNTYNFKINPLNSMHLWGKSLVTSKLLPPLIVVAADRPKKNRRKGLDEKASMNAGGKLSRQGKTTRCGKCGELGHNQRSCTNCGGVGENSGSKRKKKKTCGNKKTKLNVGASSG